jgi:hypothetical protein
MRRTRNCVVPVSVAKEGYVEIRYGWFRDRSAAYLASGKPVLAQATGFSESLPTCAGLLAFRHADDIVRPIETINLDHPRDCRKARQIAEEYFDSTKVLGSMLRDCGQAWSARRTNQTALEPRLRREV